MENLYAMFEFNQQAKAETIHSSLNPQLFKSKQKKFEGDFKIKLCDKRLYPTESVKFLGVKIDTNPSWQYHVNDLNGVKLSLPK